MSATTTAPGRLLHRLAAVTALGVVGGLACMPAATAADGDVQVVNTETIQVYTDATGRVQTKRVYEQLSMTGTGSVEVANPIETQGLRNLDEFGGFTVEDGRQVTTATVDGEQRLRSVSEYSGDLPLTVDVQYFLDGDRVDPADVVGAEGRLEVLYKVTNVTARPQEVTFDDGRGGTVTRTVDVPIPMVGSLTTTAPESFTDVRSDQANLAGDGKGGTKLSFTMTLFPPLGADSVEFGYSATITDGVVPRAEISALPLNPLESPTFQTAASSYESGADTGSELAEGAETIDQNLLKLRDGASELLAGLLRLREGSDQLERGLAGEAVPGAQRLADGASQLSAGLGELDSGAGRLADGTSELLAGTGELMSGAGRLDAGARELGAGAATAAQGGQALAAGAGRLNVGLGDLDGGVGELGAGADQLSAGQQALEAGLNTLYEGVNALPQSVQAELDESAEFDALLGSLQAIADGVGTRGDAPTTPTLLGGINAIQYGMRHPAGYAANDCAVAQEGGTPERCGAMDGVQFIAEQLAQGATDMDQLKPLFDTLNGVSGFRDTDTGALGDPCPGFPDYALPPVPPTNPCQVVATLYYAQFGAAGGQARLNRASQGLSGIHQQVQAQLLATDSGGLDRLRAGLSNGDPAACLTAKGTADPGDDCGVREGALFLKNAGIPMLVSSITSSITTELLNGIGTPTGVCDPDQPTLLCGAGALTDGGQELAAGINKLADGVVQLSAGGAQLSAGAQELAAGLEKLDAGAGRLAKGTGDLEAGAKRLNDGASRLHDGAGQLADGTGQAKDGADRIADGAGELAVGLGDAANGSSRITDGLEQAADGAPKLVDGAERLSEEGTSQLVEAGEDTAQTYGEMYATIAAGAERAEAEKMAYGAPEGAVGLTAYSFVIRGEDGETGRNVARGVAGLALLGAAAGVFALRRRFV